MDRFVRLISDLLDVARIDQGLFELTREPMDLTALVREAAGAFEVPDISIEVDAASELRVIADPVRVRQAVENLLANAVQHAPHGTTVSVRVDHAKSDGVPCALVIIADQGEGVDPALLSRLFERFSRSPNSAGLGIGLFLARQIAIAHGGNLEVTSSARTGTRFCMLLPAESV